MQQSGHLHERHVLDCLSRSLKENIHSDGATYQMYFTDEHRQALSTEHFYWADYT